MKTNFGTPTAALLVLGLLVTPMIAQQASPAQTSTTTHASPGASQARIVRLSEIRGEVRIDRNTGQVEKAILNLPIIQGTKLGATAGSFAEVEFEDGSTLHITPGTMAEFPQLALSDSGAKVSTVNIPQGTAYVNFLGGKDDEFTLSVGGEKLLLARSTDVRISVEKGQAKLAVFKGAVRAQGPAGEVLVGKNKSLTFNLAGQTAPTLAKNMPRGPYDDWEEAELAYHQQYAKAGAYGNPPYAYGISDMNYYGRFANVTGCGLVWSPYFASASWNPYMNGTWAWYPGAGYSWVSAYPWGWLPFHYGAWEFCPGYGWGWHPGATWTGLHNPPKPVKPPQGFPRPHAPKPPTAAQPMLVAVNRTPGAVSAPSPIGKLTVQRDSAGLGVPRGAIANPAEVSRQVAQHGSASVKVSAVHSAAGPLYGMAVTGGPAALSRQGAGGQAGSSTYSHQDTGGAGHSEAMGSSGGAEAASSISAGGSSAGGSRSR